MELPSRLGPGRPASFNLIRKKFKVSLITSTILELPIAMASEKPLNFRWGIISTGMIANKFAKVSSYARSLNI